MGYHMTIVECDLHYNNLDRSPIDPKDLCYSWYCDEGHIFPEGNEIKWDEDMINDLLFMTEHGIRGTLELRGEEEELTLYKLTEEGVNEFFGETTYSKEPDVMHKKEA